MEVRIERKEKYASNANEIKPLGRPKHTPFTEFTFPLILANTYMLCKNRQGLYFSLIVSEKRKLILSKIHL